MARDPLLVSIARLRKQIGAIQECAVTAPFDPTGELKAPSPGESDVPEGGEVSFQGTLEATVNGVIVSGEVTARWVGECRRCAKPLSGDLWSSVQERYLEEASADDEEAYPLKGDTIDLGPMVRDAVVLELPLAPLCSESCEGLCGQCGADLNHGDCGCGDPVDPRWARLDVLRPESG